MKELRIEHKKNEHLIFGKTNPIRADEGSIKASSSWCRRAQQGLLEYEPQWTGDWRRHHRRPGPVIPLSAVTTLVPTVGALQVNHQGQQPSMRGPPPPVRP